MPKKIHISIILEGTEAELFEAAKKSLCLSRNVELARSILRQGLQKIAKAAERELNENEAS